MKIMKIFLVNAIFIAFLLFNIRFTHKKEQDEEDNNEPKIIGKISYSIWKNLSLLFDHKNDQHEFINKEVVEYLNKSKYKRKLELFLSKSIDRFEFGFFFFFKFNKLYKFNSII